MTSRDILQFSVHVQFFSMRLSTNGGISALLGELYAITKNIDVLSLPRCLRWLRRAV